MNEQVISICSVCQKFKTQHPSGVCVMCRHKDPDTYKNEPKVVYAEVIENHDSCPLCGQPIDGHLSRLRIKL